LFVEISEQRPPPGWLAPQEAEHGVGRCFFKPCNREKEANSLSVARILCPSPNKKDQSLRRKFWSFQIVALVSPQ